MPTIQAVAVERSDTNGLSGVVEEARPLTERAYKSNHHAANRLFL